ncbi:MAG: response regulator [Vicinamibacterales bacterium]
MKSKLRVLLADDHATVREGLRAILSSRPGLTVVGEAGSGEEALARAAELRPDIVVIDISMPQTNGLHATSALKAQLPGTRVVALTRHSSEGYVQELLSAGADGYVLKQSRVEELLHAIRVVADGGQYVDAALTARAYRTSPHRPVAPGDHGTRLTGREEEVLRLVARGHSNKEIAARLNVSVKTVETHKAHATGKLGLQGRIDVVRFAMLMGWLLDDD